MKKDENKSYFQLGKTINARTYQPSRPALHAHSTVCHKKTFKAADGTCTNKVEGQNSIIKGPYKDMRGLPKNLIPMYLDQIMFEGFANYVMPFSSSSNSQSEKDKSENVLVMFVVALSELYCHDNLTWCFDTDFVSDGSKIPISEDLYDYYKDQGYALNDDDIPADDEHSEDTEINNNEYDPNQYNESDLDFEQDDSDSDYSVF